MHKHQRRSRGCKPGSARPSLWLSFRSAAAPTASSALPGGKTWETSSCKSAATLLKTIWRFSCGLLRPLGSIAEAEQLTTALPLAQRALKRLGTTWSLSLLSALNFPGQASSG